MICRRLKARLPALCRVWLCLVLALGCLCLCAPVAEADSLLKEAERLYLDGVKLARQGKYREALAKFRASYRIVPSAKEPQNEFIRGTLHLLIGRAYHKMKKWKDARDHYRKCLAILTKDKRRPKVFGWLKELRPHLLATLELSSKPASICTVTYPGGKWTGATPAVVTLESGKVKITCNTDKFYPTEASLTIAPRATASRKIILAPLPKDHSWIGLAIGALGIAAAGTGGLLGGLAMMDHGQARDIRDGATGVNDTASAKELYGSAQSKALGANVLYGVGGGLAITGLILYFVLKPRSATKKSAFLHRIGSRPLRANTRSYPPSFGALGSRFWQGIRIDERNVSLQTPPAMARP